MPTPIPSTFIKWKGRKQWKYALSPPCKRKRDLKPPSAKRCTILSSRAAGELGNLQYDLHRDLEKPGVFVFFERWASSEALDKHNETAHFQQFVSRLDGKLDVLDIKKLKKIA